MKKNKIILLASTLLFSTPLLASCGGENETIESVEIAGPLSVIKGQTITLIADVIGSEDDSVIWESLNEDIATINEAGVVTGIEVGSATIKATAKKDQSFYAEYVVTVYLNKSEEISMKVYENEYCKYDSINSKYNVALGKSFNVEAIIDPKYATPDFAYEIIYPAETSVYNTVLIEQNEDDPKFASITPYEIISDVVLKLKGTYSADSTQLIYSIKFDVYDPNVDKIAEVNNRLNAYKNLEKENLTSSKISNTREYSDDAQNKYSKVYEAENYNHLNASYTLTSTKTYDANNVLQEEVKENYYHTVYNNKYYAFTYDEDQYIKTLIANNKQIISGEGTSLDYSEFVPYTINNFTGVTYGISALFNDYINSGTIYGDIVTFGDVYAYSNLDITLSDNEIKLYSAYYNENSLADIELELVINFEGNYISSYSYKQVVEADSYQFKFEENGSNFTYGNKSNDNANLPYYLNIQDYFYSSFEVSEIAGTGDYTNLDKYGADLVTVENGLKKYTLTYDKALVLKVNTFTPEKASIYVDNITCSSSDTNQIPSVDSTTISDVFTINAKKDDNSLSQPGKATFTFTSSLGITNQIIVEFVEAPLENVFTSNIDSSNDLGEIFVGDYSSYFFINTTPDEDHYTFALDIISGDEEGIELYRHSDGNKYNYPGFSYSILGLKAGTYSFKIFVEGYETVVTENTYTITVKDKLSAEEIKDKLFDKVYRYTTSTVTYELIFKNETQITYNYYAYGDVITKTISYYIADGLIMIDGTQNLGTDAYYSYVKGDAVEFSEDFSSITLYLEQYEPDGIPFYDENGDLIHKFHAVTFTRYVDKSNFMNAVNGNTYSIEEFLYGLAKMCKFTITFNDGKATLVITRNDNSETVATITFDYTYDSSYQKMNVSKISSSNSSCTINTSASSNGDYIIYSFKLIMVINYGGSSTQIEFAI